MLITFLYVDWGIFWWWNILEDFILFLFLLICQAIPDEDRGGDVGIWFGWPHQWFRRCPRTLPWVVTTAHTKSVFSICKKRSWVDWRVLQIKAWIVIVHYDMFNYCDLNVYPQPSWIKMQLKFIFIYEKFVFSAIPRFLLTLFFTIFDKFQSQHCPPL